MASWLVAQGRYRDMIVSRLRAAHLPLDLLYDAMIGDATLFQRADQIEAGWAAVEPALERIADGEIALNPYAAGTVGPEAAESLPARDGFRWSEIG